jgi:acyltransferase
MKLRQSEPGLSGQAASNRYGFIDNAKAIGIILIVCGHGKGLPAYLSHFIFSFHVPLFFFISGFLLKSGKLNTAVGTNIKKTLRTLGVPYVLFFLLAWIYWLATRHIGSKALLFGDEAWYAPTVGLFTGLEADLFVDPPLWFFPCVMLTIIIYHAARKWMTLTVSSGLFVLFALVLSLLWKNVPYRLPLGLDNAWIGLAFYALGQYVREKDFFSNGWSDVRRSRLLAILCVALALLGYAALLNGQVDLANMRFGIWPALYLPTALVGIVAVLATSLLLPPSKMGNWLSANTLTIFPAHFLFLSLGRGLAVMLHLIPADYHYGLGWNMVSSAVAIAFCVPLVYCLRRSPVPIIG